MLDFFYNETYFRRVKEASESSAFTVIKLRERVVCSAPPLSRLRLLPLAGAVEFRVVYMYILWRKYCCSQNCCVHCTCEMAIACRTFIAFKCLFREVCVRDVRVYV